MRTWPFRIIVCLVLGAVTTVVVSWALALAVPRGVAAPPRFSRDVRYFDDIKRGRLWYFTVRGWPWANEIVSANLTPSMSRDQRVIDPARAVDASTIPVWSIMRRPQRATAGPYIEIGYGWPAPALWMQVDHSAGVTALTGAMALPRPLRSSVPGIGVPIQPHVGASVANVLVHGAAWMALLFGGASLRGCRRRRRGRCTRCGYDLRGCPGNSITCPECGRPTVRAS